MAEINRFSSRRQRLDHAFLKQRLLGARSYKRIAGYFRSSIFELIGEEIAGIPQVQIVCNSELDVADIAISKHVRETALKERWNEALPEVEALLHRQRYRKLYELLTNGNVQIRVVPRQSVFVHGKAGVIEASDGTKISFLGSINETKSAFEENYEILWEDTSPEGVAWVEEEFDALWNDAYPLPDAIVEEIKRVADRIEIRFEETSTEELPAAALAESPIYRGGEQLQPWQRSFVTMFLEHREMYGRSRLLLADEVGVGKTLSLAASAMVSALLDDGPVLILCPSTLTLQWQVELADKLGIPSAVWMSSRKVWIDPRGHVIKTSGPEDIGRCPMHIAIVSTGLIFHNTQEREYLLSRKYGTVILDEAHRARRRGGLGRQEREPNNLLSFMLQIAERTKHLLLGTATPIQTEVYELWDLMRILNAGPQFVLGREIFSPQWADWQRAIPLIKGDETPETEKIAWELIRNPLPASNEGALFSTLRLQLGLADDLFYIAKGYGSLDFVVQQLISEALTPGYFKKNNPIVRHTVLRRRKTLEELGLMEKVGVEVHPNPHDNDNSYPGVRFDGLGLQTNYLFDRAYEAAENYTAALRQRNPAAGFMKTLLLQRICSSFASGRKTAEHLLGNDPLEDEEQLELITEEFTTTQEEAQYLRIIVDELSRPEARDPKLEAVRYFLTSHHSEGKTWLEHGCIIFSQYYDTVYWIGSELAKVLASEPIGVYAGTGKSGLFRGEEFAAVDREEIKEAVKQRDLRLVVATDAACEGLNLQMLGTLINVDLPWNPSRLEQRLGRIKRFGQARHTVDMLNLVYSDTQDERIYQTLSRRMKDRYDIFGGLPDTIEDEWIENVELLEEMMDQYIHLRQEASNTFELRYQETIDPDKDRWELCSRVLSRRDVMDKLSEPW